MTYTYYTLQFVNIDLNLKNLIWNSDTEKDNERMERKKTNLKEKQEMIHLKKEDTFLFVCLFRHGLFL